MSALLPLARPAVAPRPMLRVSDLRQWVYCPRVAWFTLVCPLPKVESFKMQMGLKKEARLAQLQRRRTLRSFGLADGTVERNVDVFSSQLGLTGKLDLMIRRQQQRFPVEVKFTHGPARLNHQVQLAGYAMLLEDMYGVPVSHGYVVRLPDDSADRIEITGDLRALVSKIVVAVREMIREERVPAANPILARCQDCEYRNFCGDVL